MCNYTPITMPATGTTGPSNPYPSTITVTRAAAVTQAVTVQLAGITHARPDDLDVLLVGPTGASIVLMSDVGSGSLDGATDVDLTFTDRANPIDPFSFLRSGSFRPTNPDAGDAWPAPAPTASAATALTTFNGLDPNGVWSLYIVDDLASSGGGADSVAGGWCLTITTPPDAGGPYTVAEGAGLTLDASGSMADPAAAYSWDVNGDGTFGDASGVGPTLTSAQLEALGIDDGPAEVDDVKVQITSGGNTDVSEATTITVTNTAPTLSITAPASTFVEAVVSVTVTATDPSSVDQAAGFAFVIIWGDATAPETATRASRSRPATPTPRPGRSPSPPPPPTMTAGPARQGRR